jgi:hypothetical protein
MIYNFELAKRGKKKLNLKFGQTLREGKNKSHVYLHIN